MQHVPQTLRREIAPSWPALGLVLMATLFPFAMQPARGQAPAKGAAPVQAESKTLLELETLTAETLHARLEKVLRRKLPTSTDPSGTWLGFNIDQVNGPPLTIWASTQLKQAQLSGSPQLVKIWEKVIGVMDAPKAGPNTTEFIAAQPRVQTKVRQAVKAIQVATETPPNQVPESPAQAAPGAAPRDSVSIGLLGPVQIENVDNTDILLLRGNPRDIQRVLEVIEEIEEMTEIGEPLVEVVQLQHVESEALAELLSKIFTESLNSQNYGYGKLGVYPLSRPNAILLIALPTTMQRAKETLSKLDLPGKEATQFETFSLKHANAADIRRIVESLFSAEVSDEDATSLAPQAQVIDDVRTNSLIVRASPRDLKEVSELIDQIDKLGSEATNQLRIFKLKSSVATDLEDVLQEAFSGGQDGSDPGSKLSKLLQLVTIDEQGRRKLESGVLAETQITGASSANALIVTAPVESMPLLERIIEQLDQAPDAAIELKIFPLVNSDATALVDTLTELFSTSEGGRGGDESDITGLRVEVDQRTNSILAAGTRDDLVTVDAILRTLDTTEARERENRVYRLRHKAAEDLAIALNQLLEAERDVRETAPGTSSPFEQIEREVLVVNEDSSNSLLVSTSPQYFDKIDKLIRDLDVRDDMVMIQVLIAEIELGDVDEFGVELGLQDSVLFDRSLLGDLQTTTETQIIDAGGGPQPFEQQIIQSATNTPGFNFGDPSLGLGNSGSSNSVATAGRLAGQALSSFGVQRVSSDAGFGGMVLSASSHSVSMLLRALQESRRLEVLSRPQIMALDNQRGSAFIGQRVPFITQSTTTQFAGQLINSVERVNVGLELIVTPRISPDGLVVMTVFASNNRLRPLSEGVPVGISANGTPILQPIQDAIEAETTVSAVSGQTVILSGLITKTDRALHRRVPIIADIPLVGDLFRFDSVSTQRRELLIILTPHVVRNRFETEMLNQIESARMNWCLSDVVDLHGPAGLRSQADKAGVAESATIYPEQIPSEQYLPEPLVVPETLPPEAAPVLTVPAELPTPQ